MFANLPSTNDSLLHENVSNVSSSFLSNMDCYNSKPASFIFLTTNVASIVFDLPVILFILHYGVKQWRQNGSTFIAAMSHSDVFTYNIVIVELIGVFGYILVIYEAVIPTQNYNLSSMGKYLSVLHWYGQTIFNVLTCLEHYLAVVHPITYLSLKSKRGTRIRNISIGSIWLLSLVGAGLWLMRELTVSDLCICILSLMVVSYCSLSVLCALIHPGPGEQGEGRERVAQSKQRAFYTIMVILGVLVLRFAGSLVWTVMFKFTPSNGCLIMASVSWSSIPSSLVLPLLFLHRAGKLGCCGKMCDWCKSGIHLRMK